MFKPEDFTKLAFELKKNKESFSCGESSLSRTSISRLYYSNFLKIRKIIEEKLSEQNKLIFIKKKCKNKHHYIIQVFLYKISRELKKPELARLANYVKELRELRNEADYDIGVSITFVSFESVIENYEDIKTYIKLFESIEKEKFNQVFGKISHKCN